MVRARSRAAIGLLRFATAATAFIRLAGLATLLLLLLIRPLLLAGLPLLLSGLLLLLLALAALALFQLIVELRVFLEADVLALFGLELHTAVAFGLIAATLLAVALPLLLLLSAAGACAGLLLAWILLLLLTGVLLLAGIPVLVVHLDLLSRRTVAG